MAKIDFWGDSFWAQQASDAARRAVLTDAGAAEGVDPYEGDPKIYLGANGAYFQYRDGQPVMDSGVENEAFIALLTEPGWVGNFYLTGDAVLGSNFLAASSAPVTLTQLANVAQAAEKALQGGTFGKHAAEVSITNPTGTRLDVTVTVAPPGGTPEEVALSRNGANWVNQAQSPASAR